MIEKILRPWIQRLFVNPIVRFFGERISPLAATGFGLILGLASAGLLAMGFSFLAVFSLLLSGYFDILDGSLARGHKKASSLGAVLDITADRTVEFAVILGLFLYDPAGRAIPCLLMLGSVLVCVSSFLVVGIFSQNTTEKSFYYSPGIIERAEAFILWILMILCPAGFALLAYVFSGLVSLTAAVRLIQFSKNFS